MTANLRAHLRMGIVTMLIPFLCSEHILGQNWVLKGPAIKGTAAYHHAGRSLSISGDGTRLAVAEPGFANSSYTGSVLVYDWDGMNWIPQDSVITGGPDYFVLGYTVCLSDDGNTLAVTSLTDDNSEAYAGSVRLYAWNGNTWIQKGQDIDGAAANDGLGTAIALNNDGSIFVVGASGNDEAFLNAGQVRVYQWNGNDWMQFGQSINGLEMNEAFGFSVSISGDGQTIVAGAIHSSGILGNMGMVRPYSWDGSNWVIKDAFLEGDSEDGYSGWDVELNDDGSQLALSAIGNNEVGTLAGQVRVYNLDLGHWVRKGDNLNGNSHNQFGWSISFSDDGNTLAIGAFPDEWEAFYPGYVSVYRWNGNQWEQAGDNIEEDVIDGTGSMVSLSDDGTSLAIGAYLDNEVGLAAGKVRVYKNDFSSAIDDIMETSILVYPNPATTFLNITVGFPIQNARIRITNALGQTLISQNINSGDQSFHLDVSTLTHGLFFLEMISGDLKVTEKLLKE